MSEHSFSYTGEEILAAFRVYRNLSLSGTTGEEDLRRYKGDHRLRQLVDEFAEEVDCVVITAGDRLLLVPKAMRSPFHISNEAMKNKYLPGRALNADLYLLYAAVLVFFGTFYDSYQTNEPQLDFLPVEEWLQLMNQRMEALGDLEPRVLEKTAIDQEINWPVVVEKWEALDDIKEGVKLQKGRTGSRLSFMNAAAKFLLDQDLAEDLGNDELALTEKARVIVQRYYMDIDRNREIMDFLFSIKEAMLEEVSPVQKAADEKGGEAHATDFQNSTQ